MVQKSVPVFRNARRSQFQLRAEFWEPGLGHLPQWSVAMFLKMGTFSVPKNRNVFRSQKPERFFSNFFQFRLELERNLGVLLRLRGGLRSNTSAMPQSNKICAGLDLPRQRNSVEREFGKVGGDLVICFFSNL